MGRIVWLASYPRSGNTWLRLFLHALVNGPYKGVGFPPLERFAPNEASPVFYRTALGKAPEQATRAELAAARETAQMLAAARTGGPNFLKTHHQAGYHLGFPTVNLSSSAGAIYLVRNPLDVAISIAAFLKTDLATVADIMRKGSDYVYEPPGASYYYLGGWAAHVDSWTGRRNPFVLTVRYEDMLADTLGTFTQIARFLKLPAESVAIETALEVVRFEDLRRREAALSFVESPNVSATYFREGRSGAWQGKIEAATIRTICEGSAHLLRRFRYESVIEAMK